jgi:multiple sugar transport system ATP-binding protein
MAEISLRNLVKRYDDGYLAVDDVSLDIADGEFMILVGPSGCGKSTILRMIVGLEDVTSGDVFIDGERVNEKAPRERDLAMVFQNYALYPHLSVAENLAFPLRLSGRYTALQIKAKVEEAAYLLELDEHLDRKPSQLSGGQRQRVAMGRALVRDARAYLFDEPLSNLDARLRSQMRTEIARLQRDLGSTTVYVTHDQVEAMTLGHRVAVLRKGTLQQVDTPRELYERPANLFVAGFIGSPPMNLLPAKVEGRWLTLPFSLVELSEAAAERLAGHPLVLAGIRPEHFEDAALVDDEAQQRGVVFSATVDVVEWLGGEQFAYILYPAPPQIAQQLRRLAQELDSDLLRTQLVVALDPGSDIRADQSAEIWANTTRMHIFDPETGENLTRDL